MITFACIQLLLSQIPNFHNLSWLSILAAIMSFAYSSIGLGLSVAKVIGNKNIEIHHYSYNIYGYEHTWNMHAQPI